MVRVSAATVWTVKIPLLAPAVNAAVSIFIPATKPSVMNEPAACVNVELVPTSICAVALLMAMSAIKLALVYS